MVFYICLRYINSYISCKVIEIIDFGTHTMFKAEVIDAKSISNDETVTYTHLSKKYKTKTTIIT